MSDEISGFGHIVLTEGMPGKCDPLLMAKINITASI